jgi:hypothetical protein
MKVEKKYQSDINILIAVAEKYSGEIKSFEEVFRTTKNLRIQHPFSLRPYEELSPKTKLNFENRIARFIGGTKESINPNKKQSQIFNIENILGKKCSNWIYPINPKEKLSPQVKREGQKFKFPTL